MFFSREDEPDLGDELRGSSYGREESYDYTETSYSPSNAVTKRKFIIPLSFYKLSKVELEDYFKKRLQAKEDEKDKIAREIKIKELRAQLEVLEKQDENQDH